MDVRSICRRRLNFDLGRESTGLNANRRRNNFSRLKTELLMVESLSLLGKRWLDCQQLIQRARTAHPEANNKRIAQKRMPPVWIAVKCSSSSAT
jgi:hypothetical protein